MSDNSADYGVQPLGDHEYLLRVPGDAREAEFRFRVSPNVLKDLGVDSTAEQFVVRETAAFLLEHQPVMDLPPMIDLEDVAAAYDGYLNELRERLAPS
ncbi:hypothetical protein [Streptomyces xantholiticus]|uniref:hypothetical protein n=1 Tax=Streptomyces xantholiticus TaxID=68285 RepID=UPI00167BFC11|nr:hypothetical protein [Streptomyces xantholiticus]GGW72778.1 hypothetical protein GCM10010381_66950 [Streptomyces xantholiticus]